MAKPIKASFREFLQEGGGFRETEKPLDKHGRHIIGALSRNGGKYFVKLEAKPGKGWAAPSLLRETHWGITVGELKNAFSTPTIVEHWVWKNRHYIISERVEGLPLVAKFSDDPGLCTTYLDKLVEIALNLVTLSAETVAAIPEDGIGDASSFIKKTRRWFNKINDNEQFADLMEAVEKRIAGCFVPSPNHGDFTPWHLLVSDEIWYLIDAEHAGTAKPKWYDVVYFAHRLATQCNGFAEMKQFFRRFHDALEPMDQREFYAALYPLMASRIIGGVWDAQNDASDMGPHLHIAQAWRNREL